MCVDIFSNRHTMECVSADSCVRVCEFGINKSKGGGGNSSVVRSRRGSLSGTATSVFCFRTIFNHSLTHKARSRRVNPSKCVLHFIVFSIRRENKSENCTSQLVSRDSEALEERILSLDGDDEDESLTSRLSSAGHSALCLFINFFSLFYLFVA